MGILVLSAHQVTGSGGSGLGWQLMPAVWLKVHQRLPILVPILMISNQIAMGLISQGCEFEVFEFFFDPHA